MNRTPIAFLLIAALACFFPACETQVFHIEMTPQGAAMARKIALHPDPESLSAETESYKFSSPEDQKRLAAIYHKIMRDSRGMPIRYEGVFSGKTPGDVGGAGHHMHFESALGAASLYMERFQGNDNLSDQLVRIQRSCDEAADLMIEFATERLGKHPKFPDLKKYMTTDVRRDLKNLALTFWAVRAAEAISPAPPPVAPDTPKNSASPSAFKGEEAFFSRLWQYLLEHGYVTPEDTPSTVGSRTFFASAIRRIVYKRLGLPLDHPATGELAFLSDEDSLSEALTEFIDKRVEAKLAEWEKANPGKAMEDAPDFKKHYHQLHFDMIGGPGFFHSHAVNVKLKLPAPPIFSNGYWEEKTSTLHFIRPIQGDQAIPTLLYAGWVDPNEKFQREHFGHLLLTGEDLFSYIDWYITLPDDLAAQWDVFVEKLAPGDETLKKLSDFVFERPARPPVAKPPRQNEEPDDLYRGPKLLQNKLQEKLKPESE